MVDDIGGWPWDDDNSVGNPAASMRYAPCIVRSIDGRVLRKI